MIKNTSNTRLNRNNVLENSKPLFKTENAEESTVDWFGKLEEKHKDMRGWTIWTDFVGEKMRTSDIIELNYEDRCAGKNKCDPCNDSGTLLCWPFPGKDEPRSKQRSELVANNNTLVALAQQRRLLKRTIKLLSKQNFQDPS